ncbi:MAG: 3'-5' exonuclease, partial [Candidatus Micrarchaeia archaeon]
YRIFKSNENFAKELEEIGMKFGSLRFSLDLAAKSLNSQNSVIYNWDNGQYELVLQPKSEVNPYVKGGTEPEGMLLTDERIPYICWKSLSTCFIDIEKPMWKTEEERKIMQEISELQAELANKNSTMDPSEINEKIQELTKKMVMKMNQSGDVNLLEDKYKEQISRVMIHLRKEDGSIKRLYFKLRNTAINNERKEINGFTVLYFDTEYELLNAVIKFIKQEKPYRIVGHVIPYDLSEIRDSARKNKTERFDIAVKKKEPRLWRRDFYQKISLAAQEILDTHRLASVWFPYLKMKPFDLSHKLADVANFIYLQKKRMYIKTVMDSEFHKIATHDELKELEIMAINGNKDAEYKLDFYSTHDIDPLIEIFDFEPTLKLLYKAAAMVPHVPITDVAFSPTSMNEIFHLREWKVRHTQLHYGYKQKKREDERQIFKKRLNEYMKRQLMDEGIPQVKPGLYYDAYMTYIPLELMLSSTFFPSKPEWNLYFSTLHYDPIIRIAELQYPKYFMRQNIHVDYYLYRREMDIYREILRLLNISKDEAIKLMQRYYVAVAKADGTATTTISKKELDKQSLVRQYYAAYETVKDKFRSFYVSLKTKDKKASKKIKNHIRKGSTRREDNQLTFNFVNFFEKENSDIIKLYNLPNDLESALEESSKEKLDRFKSQFDRLMEIKNKIVSILSKSEYSDMTDKISAENMVFLFNQYMRAIHYKDLFNAVYHINPEGRFSFRTLIDNVYKTIGEWIRSKNLYVIGAKGDYLFIKDKDGKDIDFIDSPLIPIKKFDKLDLVGDVEDTDTFLEELENYD